MNRINAHAELLFENECELLNLKVMQEGRVINSENITKKKEKGKMNF